MINDEDPLDLFEDDGDGVNEMCLLFDEDSKRGDPKGQSRGTGCAVVLLLLAASVISGGVLLEKYFA